MTAHSQPLYSWENWSLGFYQILSLELEKKLAGILSSIHIVCMRKLSHSDVKCFIQGPTAG